MTPEDKQAAIDQVQQIAKNGCAGITCDECVLPTKDCFSHNSHEVDERLCARFFLAGIDFEKGDE